MKTYQINYRTNDGSFTFMPLVENVLANNEEEARTVFESNHPDFTIYAIGEIKKT